MKVKPCLLLLFPLLLLMTVVHLLMFNVHTSALYVQRQAKTCSANFTIAPKCMWAKNGSFDFGDYKPRSFVLIARLLSVVYEKHGIMTIVRDGSFLHLIRGIKADNDMDFYMIVPKTLTLPHAYPKIRYEIGNNPEFKNITLETHFAVISAIFFHKCDAARIFYNGKQVGDVVVLHETFLNDADLQSPCIGQMNCHNLSELDDPYIKANIRHLTTKNLFQSLCQCIYMDSSLFCFNEHGAQYLEVRYGKGYDRKQTKREEYILVYERPYRSWRFLISTFPPLYNIKFLF